MLSMYPFVYFMSIREYQGYWEICLVSATWSTIADIQPCARRAQPSSCTSHRHLRWRENFMFMVEFSLRYSVWRLWFCHRLRYSVPITLKISLWTVRGSSPPVVALTLCTWLVIKKLWNASFKHRLLLCQDSCRSRRRSRHHHLHFTPYIIQPNLSLLILPQ